MLARRVGRWRVVSVALLVAVAVAVLVVEIGLSDTTPGPTLAAPWRWIVALGSSVVTVCAWAIIHALRSTRHQPGS